MRIGVVLPTYNDGKLWYDMLPRFAKSLEHIKDVNNLVFLVNYQNVDLMNLDDCAAVHELDFAIEGDPNAGQSGLNPTWSLKVAFNAYQKPISMVRIRNDAMMLDPSCDLYLFVDDDIKFNPGAGACYNEIIKAFEEDSNLGMVMSAGFLGGYNYADKEKGIISYVKKAVEKHWMTNRGLFFRNIYSNKNSPLYPDFVLDRHVGGCEEFIAAFEQIRKKRDLGTHFNNPTTHKVTSMSDKEMKKTVRWEDDQIHKQDESFMSATVILHVEYGVMQTVHSIGDFQKALRMIKNRG